MWFLFRTLLLDMTVSLEEWLVRNYCHPELAFWLPCHTRLRGTRWFSDSPLLFLAMKQVAESQDLIPWMAFMERKLLKEIFILHRHALTASPPLINIADWSSQLISKIVHISHAQWIFRNVLLQNVREGYLHH